MIKPASSTDCADFTDFFFICGIREICGRLPQSKSHHASGKRLSFARIEIKHFDLVMLNVAEPAFRLI